MSHISTYKLKIKNISSFLNVCKNRGYDVLLGKQTVRQFGSNEVNCVGSLLITGWSYRIAITDKGELKYDHFGSQPGTMELLGESIQEYNEQELMLAIPYDEISQCYKETLENGDVRVVLEY